MNDAKAFVADLIRSLLLNSLHCLGMWLHAANYLIQEHLLELVLFGKIEPQYMKEGMKSALLSPLLGQTSYYGSQPDGYSPAEDPDYYTASEHIMHLQLKRS